MDSRFKTLLFISIACIVTGIVLISISSKKRKSCQPSCNGNNCGDDGCGGTCGTCNGNCVNGQCTGCTPDCNNKVCGSDGCGGSCGSCSGNCVDGQCVCQPDCNGKNCGSDGCGGSCGTCKYGNCQIGQCVCQPQCVGKTCGDDGCGGSCGTCSGKTSMCYKDNCVVPCRSTYRPMCSPGNDGKSFYIQIGGPPGAVWGDPNSKQYCASPGNNECYWYDNSTCYKTPTDNIDYHTFNNGSTEPVCDDIVFYPYCAAFDKSKPNTPWYIKVGGDPNNDDWSTSNSSCIATNTGNCQPFQSADDCQQAFSQYVFDA